MTNQREPVNEILGDDDTGYAVAHTEWFPGALDAVKFLHNTGAHGTRDLRPLMHIPGVLIEEWCRKQGVTFYEFTRSDELRRRMIEDPDLSLWRVWRGAL